jgi:uncharacterized small protein (DUF1192 family)
MELEELLTRKLQFCEYLESWGLDESSRRIAMLYDELARLRAEVEHLRERVKKIDQVEDVNRDLIDECKRVNAENAALRSEVDRLRRIEDAALGFNNWMESSQDKTDLEMELKRAIETNARQESTP